MCMEITPGVIDLKEVATGKTLARLEDPHGDRAPGWLGFTPDGTRLVAVYTYSQLVHVWDLRLIRARLNEIGLDWEWHPFPAVDRNGTAARPITVKVLAGDLAKPPPILTPEQKARQDIEQYRPRVAANPNDPNACNGLAWAYLTAPEALRDVKAALPLAEKAARLAPEDAVIRNTLGLAYYRIGKYREAIDTLRPRLARQQDWCLAFDLYVLAMSHQRLGEASRAQDYYEWALRWTSTQPGLEAGLVEELAQFRAEVEALLLDRGKKE